MITTESTCLACSDSEENYAWMRPSFPGRGEKWLLHSFSVIKGVRDPDSLETSSRGLRVVPWLSFLFFSFPTLRNAPFLAHPLDSTRSNNLRTGRNSNEIKRARWTTVVLSTEVTADF